MKIYEVNRSQVKEKLDIVIVPFDYQRQELSENVFTIFIGGEIPIKVMSKTITEKQFAKMCGDT
jgi:hypothetical protein